MHLPKKLALYYSGATLALPALLFAQEMGFDPAATQTRGRSFSTLVYALIDIIDTLVVIVVALSLLVFLWGMALFILKSGDNKSHSQGRDLMLWGLIIFFVMGSLWGIVKLVSSTIF